MKVGITTSGLRKVQKNLDKKIAGMGRAALSGLLAGGQIIFREAQAHVPIDTGHLAGSGYVRRGEDDNETVVVGYEASYALFVHENTGARFKRPAATAKWLENAVKAKAPEVRNEVARRMRGAV